LGRVLWCRRAVAVVLHVVRVAVAFAMCSLGAVRDSARPLVGPAALCRGSCSISPRIVMPGAHAARPGFKVAPAHGTSYLVHLSVLYELRPARAWRSRAVLAQVATPALVLCYRVCGRMTKAHHVIVMGFNVLGYLGGVPSMLLRNTPSMVSGMSVMKTSASALAPGTAST